MQLCYSTWCLAINIIVVIAEKMNFDKLLAHGISCKLYTCTCTVPFDVLCNFVLYSLLQNVVDILVGWHIDTHQDESLINFIGG